MDQAFLIDVSGEDDSLLPAGNTVIHRNADHPQKPSSEAADAIKKDDLLCQQVSNGNPEEPGNLALPVMTEEPALVKKKKKAGFNVRKSLAWNNAFFTEEGVLDSEELSLVNRTFQRPLGLPKPSTFKKPVQASNPVKPPIMPKLNLNSHKAALTAERKENQKISALISPSSSTDSLIESLPKSSEQHVNIIKGSSRIMHGASTPISLTNMQMDTSMKEKALVEALAGSAEPKLLRRSIDQKDQGSSLPGINHYKGEDYFSVLEMNSNKQAAMASGSLSSKGAMYLKQIGKDSRGISQSINKEAMRQSSLMKLTGDSVSLAAVPRARPTPSSIKLISEPASTKIQHTTQKSSSFEPGTFAGRDKPSGLRMPSPKLGFFDMSRTASQVAMPHERTGHGRGVNGKGRDVENGSSRYAINQNQGLTHPAASAKPNHQLLEASRKQGVEIRSSSSIPSAPHVHKHSAGVASMRVAPVQELSRSVSYPSNRVNKQTDNIQQVLQARKNGQNGSTQGKPALRQPGNSTVRNNSGQENLSPDCKDGKGMLQKCVVTEGSALERPNIKTSGEICAITAVRECQEIAQTVVEPSQKSVSQLLSSTLPGLLRQGNVEEPMEGVVSENQNCADIVRASILQKR